MSDLLFDREVIVEIGIKGQPAKRFSGLRVKFHVEQTGGSVPNKGKIEVYNLTRDSARVADQPNSMVRLIAGYKGTSQVIYVGDISPKHSKTELQGVDLVTMIECADGIDKFTGAYVEKSYKEGTPFRQVFEEVMTTLMGGAPKLDAIPDDTVVMGLTLSGQSYKAMDDLTGKLGLEWSIQDGVVQVIKKGGSTKDTAVLLSSRTGLVGIPKRKDSSIEITSLLQPSIRPGRQIELDSRLVKGRYIAGKVTHQGDNFGKDWYTIIEAKKFE